MHRFSPSSDLPTAAIESGSSISTAGESLRVWDCCVAKKTIFAFDVGDTFLVVADTSRSRDGTGER